MGAPTHRRKVGNDEDERYVSIREPSAPRRLLRGRGRHERRPLDERRGRARPQDERRRQRLIVAGELDNFQIGGRRARRAEPRGDVGAQAPPDGVARRLDRGGPRRLGLEGRVLVSDVFSALEDEQFDWIISNPPFHKERDISYGPSQRLISQAPDHLSPGGRLVIVANGFLPYPDHLQRAFQDFHTLADNRRFKVYGAIKPSR